LISQSWPKTHPGRISENDRLLQRAAAFYSIRCSALTRCSALFGAAACAKQRSGFLLRSPCAAAHSSVRCSAQQRALQRIDALQRASWALQRAHNKPLVTVLKIPSIASICDMFSHISEYLLTIETTIVISTSTYKR